jgi:hypothetical protein
MDEQNLSFEESYENYKRLIGKYLSSLRKLDHIIAPKEGLEA